MRVSIVTVCFNSEKTISDTIDSIINQSYKNIEYIIIDGMSSDSTLNIVKEYSSKIESLKIVSEKDDGIYDAMNKGISLCTGDVIAILNSDDFYYDSKVIEKVVKKFKHTESDCVFGDLIYVDAVNTDKIVRKWKSSDFAIGIFKLGWHPPHPSFFVRREMYEKYGNFDLSLKVSADFEIMLRFLERFRIKSAYLPETLVKMRVGGESGKNFRNILIGNRNILLAFDKNNIPVNKLFYPFFRLAPKLAELIKRKIF